MTDDDPYHEGEIAVQTRAGARELALRHGRLIDDRIMPAALAFIAAQPMVVVGSVAGTGEVWASMIFGEPGFIAPRERAVELHLARTSRSEGDPLWANLACDPRVGMLFIELATRRRVRVNGIASHPASDRLRIAVTESYPNCARFIHRRAPGATGPREGRCAREVCSGAQLEPVVREIVGRADTLFVASAHGTRGVDVSHRGGPPGFVQVSPDGTLRVPDYAGNGMFNTLGNLSVDPRAGLLFVDFRRGDLLKLSGRAQIRWDAADPGGDTAGTNRWWDFTPERGLLSEGAAPPCWVDLDAFPARGR